jgi:hypothetical protein
LPTRTRKPRDKAKVEAGVLAVERWILAPLRNRRFFSLAELNAAIAELVAGLNGRPVKRLGVSRAEMFAQLDRPALKLLPAETFVYAEWRRPARVARLPCRHRRHGRTEQGRGRNSLARAVALHRLGRFRDCGHENQQVRAAAPNLVTADIVLFHCRYLGRALGALCPRGMAVEEVLIPQLSLLAWDRINLTGGHVWSDALALDLDGYMLLKLPSL